MSRYINAVYYPSWSVYKDRPPSCLDVACITHIFYAFVGVNEDGTLRALDAWADNDKEVDGVKGCLAAVAELKRQNPHIKTIVSVGGGTNSTEFPNVAKSHGARCTFAREIRQFCERHELDGADIDWEHPQDPDAGRHYLQFLQEIRRALPSPWFLLTSALPVGQYCLKHIDLPAVARVLDFLNLMAYDFVGSWTDVSGHHAQLLPPSNNLNEVYPTLRTSGNGGVNYLLEHNFPRNKILLGIPAYARYFSNSHGSGHPFKESGEVDYCDLPERWVYKAFVEDVVATASFVDDEGDKGFVSFDVPSTVRAKVR
ncbi:glycoside hydrolase superfamily [Dactylonectria estremocensis]|uniref:chitinase n=1 Tax=Dactylonectria estremocensis TaxID=1079267 RepID=A0A9P9J7D7_9HYPO|nr:glycoside hydrolase superfamily [Dactylonectria estremocensis]